MRILVLTLFTLMLASCGTQSNKEKKAVSTEKIVNVYSQRHYNADLELLKRFTEKTGIEVNLVNAGADELINRLEMEGESSQADIFITVDAARLNRAKSKGLLQKVKVATVDQLNAQLSDEEGFWYPITYRARVIVYDKKDVDPNSIKTYQDLALPTWKNKVIIRSSSSGYNQSLLASIIVNAGEETATNWATGIVSNMVRDPKGGDRDQIKAMASGVGEVSIVNTYYLGLLLNSSNPEEVEVGESVGVIFPNQEAEGTHVNVSGVAVTKSAPNKENAIKLIEFLTGPEAQKYYAANSFEYPANTQVKADSTVANFGTFKADDLRFAKDMSLTEQAVSIFDQVGWK